ncbi:MAG: hypothetical protein IPL08_11415 [Saprospiraceae bacterium]|nr:hypothetical protein [Saprospiraceae bacterium]
MVDRAVEPLFPDTFLNETQIILNLLSGDGKKRLIIYAALAASAALVVSDIPFDGPISEVRIAKIGGKFVINPEEQLLNADIDLIVSSYHQRCDDGGGWANECQESEIIEAIKWPMTPSGYNAKLKLALAKAGGR